MTIVMGQFGTAESGRPPRAAPGRDCQLADVDLTGRWLSSQSPRPSSIGPLRGFTLPATSSYSLPAALQRRGRHRFPGGSEPQAPARRSPELTLDQLRLPAYKGNASSGAMALRSGREQCEAMPSVAPSAWSSVCCCPPAYQTRKQGQQHRARPPRGPAQPPRLQLLRPRRRSHRSHRKSLHPLPRRQHHPSRNQPWRTPQRRCSPRLQVRTPRAVLPAADASR